MRVLWILNMVLPSVAKELNIKTSASGGWLVDYSNKLSSDPEFELATMTYANVKEPIDKVVNNIRNFIFPGAGKRLLFNSKQCLKDCKKVLEEFRPDLIHIHGTEYAVGYSMLRVKENEPTLLTIQGVLSRISEEYYGGLKSSDIRSMSKIKDLLKLKTPFFAKKLFIKNAKRERYVLKNVKYVTGRTTWDKATMLSINSDLKYYRLNYNLREEFYIAEKWDYENIDKYTILAGASSYPLKGLHVLIDALRIIKNDYPNVLLRVVGGNAKDGKLVKPNSYEKFILKKISRYGLEENVEFIGRKSATEVSKELLKANVCVVTSAMEGASATVCEAMMVGTPCICAFRGGMTELLRDRESGFCYDFPEYPVLAERVKTLFEDRNLCEKFSKETIKDAEERHNREKNILVLKSIYKEVEEKESKNEKM